MGKIAALVLLPFAAFVWRFYYRQCGNEGSPGPLDAPHSFHSFSQFQIWYDLRNGNPS